MMIQNTEQNDEQNTNEVSENIPYLKTFLTF